MVSSTGRDVAQNTLVIDIGGGSTELVVGGTLGLSFHDSLNMGGVRLTERFLHSDPPTNGELEACSAAAHELLAHGVPRDVRPLSAIGVAGTITSIAALDLGLAEYDPDRVQGHRLSREASARSSSAWRRCRSRNAARSRRFDPDRAPVIVAGTVILGEVLDHFGLDGLEASEHDILDGAALEAAELPEPEEGAAPPGAYTCC